jgi:hypothetical protein
VSGHGVEKDAARDREKFSLPEQRERLVVLFGGRSRFHVFRDSTFPSGRHEGRWTRAAFDRRALCGSLSYCLVGVDATDWPTECQPVDISRVDCPRCLERYPHVIPPEATS